ncbi:GtrA family protein [Planococcus lenghuensis]|uniref:GtrA/DPMS transmembrane domain-containing protein n=1 Tax=Planococcus lenghuensis TaxID=2213202 RepID=A0A1Q2KZ23_9BACL|nr:GtrA family protein [Planococcus lenghuensis]AQQ53386.1 hypothetical protein B0X71_10085 [Planococcus lenghuensis]
MSFFRRNKQGLLQFANYGLIGILCAGLDLLVLNALLIFFPTTDPFLLALFNTIAYTAAVSNSYYWNAKYTFKVKKSRKQLIPYIGQAAVSLLISNLVFLAGLWALGRLSWFPGWIDTNIAKGLSMYASFQASFFFNKYLVFRTAAQKPTETGAAPGTQGWKKSKRNEDDQ